MTQTPKQWITTGFIIGMTTSIAAVILIFFLTRNEQTATAAQPVASPAPVADPALISGTIELDSSIAGKVALPAIMFVVARGADQQGHPVLAKRLDVRSFPVTFTLGPKDSMMGQAPSNRVSLEARVDLDGDAGTREPGAPAASMGAVTLGTNDVRLVLKSAN
jgi:hypothetical protein